VQFLLEMERSKDTSTTYSYYGSAAMPPMCIVLDLDGTIIGDIIYQVMLYDVFEECKLQKVHTACTNKIKKELQEQVKYALTKGMVRPHFKSFMRKVQSMGAEVFIYTASEKKWANYVVPLLEKECDVSFARPLFTRVECPDGKKLLNNIMPKILKYYRKKYDKSITEEAIRSRLCMVDNNDVYPDPADAAFMVKCPTYDMFVPVNLPSILSFTKYPDAKKVIMSYSKKYMDVMPISGGANGKKLSSQMKQHIFEKNFYSQYLKILDLFLHKEMNRKEDHMFAKLAHYLNKCRDTTITPRIISYINSKI